MKQQIKFNYICQNCSVLKDIIHIFNKKNIRKTNYAGAQSDFLIVYTMG